MHIKTIMKHYHTPVRMAIRTEKRKQTSGIGESMWELETFYTIWLNVKWGSHSGKQYDGSSKN